MTALPHARECAEVDRWLERLLEQPPSERTALLSAMRVEQPRHYSLVIELLSLAERASATLDPERIDRRAAWLALNRDSPDLPAGSRIGAWRVVRLIGRGGMGEVYEVERADGVYVQRAALKLLHVELNSAQFLTRFARERQILATLDHPGIARLIDGGDTAGARPYLVMDYVDGERIDRYCHAHAMPLRERLELFLQVADAVAHAHERHVVHRDLKPSNISVTPAGTVKLLDFGIAKVAEGAGISGTGERTETFIVTPQYSTPEQVLGKQADHRTDIYQLGLLLFEMLTGQRAQEPTDGTPAALLNAVCVATRTPPSACAALGTSEAAAVIGDLSPHALCAQLRGDLDWIVLQALRQEPARRYASVHAFVDDVRRYLRGLPVRARPETTLYRVSRFVRRHRWAVIGTAAAFAMTIAYAVTATLQARAIAVERDRAATQAKMAEQTKSLVLAMFEGANPELALGKELTAHELLDSSWPAIEAETRGQPQVQAEILNTMAETYRQLGDYERALARIQQARHIVTEHPALPAQLVAMLVRTHGRVLTDRGDYPQAQDVLSAARDLFDRIAPVPLAELATTVKDLAHLAHLRGEDAAAEPMYREALDLYRRADGDQRRAMADCMEQLAVALSQQARYSQAADLLRQTLELQRQILPRGHPDIAGNLASLAEASSRLGDNEAAESLYREALSDMRASRGHDHPFVATILNNLARVLTSHGEFSEAEQFLKEALAIRRARLGPSHDLVAMTLNDLGNLHERAEAIEAARDYYGQALALLPASHRWRGAILSNLGRVLEKAGDLKRAEQLYREAVDIKRTQYGDDHDVLAVSLQKLGALLLHQGRTADAEPLLREALRIFRLRLGDDHERTRDVTALLAGVSTPASS